MPSVSQRKYLERASETYARQLQQRSRDDSLSGARAYFSSHGINYGIALKYQLGFVAEPLPGDERFAGWLVVPYLTPNGVQAIKFRNLTPESGAGKYGQHHGQKGRLYNAQAYFEAGNVIGIAEGEMDAIAATEHLGIPTMGVPGAEGWKDTWTPLLKDFTKVLIFGDGDAAGREFASQVAECAGWRAQIVTMPEGEDVSSLVSSGRLDSIATSIRGDDEV